MGTYKARGTIKQCNLILFTFFVSFQLGDFVQAKEVSGVFPDYSKRLERCNCSGDCVGGGYFGPKTIEATGSRDCANSCNDEVTAYCRSIKKPLKSSNGIFSEGPKPVLKQNAVLNNNVLSKPIKNSRGASK